MWFQNIWNNLFSQNENENRKKHNSSQITLNLPKKLRLGVKKNAENMHITQEAFIIKSLENCIIPSEFIKPEIVQKGLSSLVDFLNRVPGLDVISSNNTHDHNWWVKFNIDIRHPLAWSVVQELGFVMNYISLTEKLPTVFMPVSPPPYLNGGPEENLSWVIESRIAYLDPKYIADVLESRLPRPVEDESKWTDLEE